MKCKFCKKEFEAVEVHHGKSYDRGDGVMYGSSSYSHKPICPHCGHNNSPKVYLKAQV